MQVSIFFMFVHRCLLLYLHCYLTFFSFFERVMSHLVLNSDKLRDTASLTL